jgi:hypothetical protein
MAQRMTYDQKDKKERIAALTQRSVTPLGIRVFVPSPPQIYLQINIARFIKALEMRGMGVDRGSAKRIKKIRRNG